MIFSHTAFVLIIGHIQNMMDLMASRLGVKSLRPTRYGVHCHLDVTFGEDHNKTRAGHGAENVSLARKAALNLLKTDTLVGAGTEIKKKVAGWNPDYLLKILGVK